MKTYGHLGLDLILAPEAQVLDIGQYWKLWDRLWGRVRQENPTALLSVMDQAAYNHWRKTFAYPAVRS